MTDHRTDTKAGHAGLSVFEALQRRFGPARIATIMITAKAGNLGSAGPSFPKRGQPWYLVRPSLTVWDGNVVRDTSVVGKLALAGLRRFAGQRFFAFFHFGDADRAVHQEGEGSDRYAEAVVAGDRWLNAIAAALRALAINRTTMVFVTADHGFDSARRLPPFLPGPEARLGVHGLSACIILQGARGRSNPRPRVKAEKVLSPCDILAR